MTSTAKQVPEGFQTVTPYLCCRDAAKAIEFYQKAFGATEVMRLAEPSGRIGHAEIKIGNGMIMLSDEYPEMNVRSPQSIGGSPVSIHLYVADVDAMFTQAVAAGATAVRPVADQFYGDRTSNRERSVRARVLPRHAQGGRIGRGDEHTLRSVDEASGEVR